MNGRTLSRENLERVSNDHFNAGSSDLDKQLWQYITETDARLEGRTLLEAELDYASQRGHISADPCDTLVLLVGFSLEPLLQSICVYKPQKIVLVLNEGGYCGETWDVFARHLTEAVGLVDRGMLPQLPQFVRMASDNDATGIPTADGPEAVFQTLLSVLHDEKDVVIDVTGGKKSMVTGAFLYAAYSGIRISYVDFDEYDPKRRRPYGYSFKIGELPNPYEQFSLREWERVRGLYERYQFRDARSLLLGSILSTMKKVISESETPIQKLGAFLEYYAMWDSGDFRGARRGALDLGSFDQPSAVEQLGDGWFETSHGEFVNKPSHFFGNIPMLKVYVCDELKRIRRLIEYNQDYRSAFLRAGGINEILMAARLARLAAGNAEKNSLLDALDDRTPRIREVFIAFEKSTITIGKKGGMKKAIVLDNCPEITLTLQSKMRSWWKNTNLFNTDRGWDNFLTRRNELAHKYFSVPRSWALEALAFVEANFEDFLEQSMKELGLRTSALPWSELCALCDLSRFLPRSLRKEVGP